MADFKQKGDKQKYSFSDSLCIGRKCWAPGMYQHRSPLSCGGSRNTGSPDTTCCLNRAYHGCPEGPIGECMSIDDNGQPYKKIGLPDWDVALVKERKADGWKLVLGS